MFGFFRKPDRREESVNRAEEWERSVTIPITEPTSNKTAYLLSNLGRLVEVNYRSEPIRIKPLSVFRKPMYGRTYVQAEHDGEAKAFNLSEIKLPPQVTIRLARRKLEPITGHSSGGSLFSTLLGGLLISTGVVALVAWYSGIVDLSSLGFDPLTKPLVAPPADITSPKDAPGESASPNPEPSTPLPEQMPPEDTSSDVSPMPPASSEPEPAFGRVFTSKAGTTVQAEFEEFQFQGSRVVLRKRDGTTLDVSMSDLSREDQEWIRNELKRRRAERAAPK